MNSDSALLDLYTTLEKSATAEKKTIMKSRSVCSVVSMEVEASKKALGIV